MKRIAIAFILGLGFVASTGTASAEPFEAPYHQCTERGCKQGSRVYYKQGVKYSRSRYRTVYVRPVKRTSYKSVGVLPANGGPNVNPNDPRKC